ncbi:MAG: 5'-nucleotidase C-terminal domain-containing protein [Bacteroidales bacterium]|nr:5'-nucleotidase C-terminal domain-containing protein [Bacteroidales bacterium]
MLTVLLAATFGASAQNKDIHFVAINDIHGNMERAAALGGVIDSLRALYPNIMVLSAGDNRTGDPISDMYIEPSRPITEVMNVFGVRASTIGNHEFDGNVSGFRRQLELSKFPYICCNTSFPDSMNVRVDPYKIFDVDGVKVGVVGVVQVNPHRGIPDCHIDKCRGITFTQPKPAIDKYVDVVRKQCDIEILLSHAGCDNDSLLAKEFPQFDVIMGGHTHKLLPENDIVNGVLITQSLNKMKYCYHVIVTVDETGKVISKKSRQINVQTTSQRNYKIVEMVKKFLADNPILSEQLCKVKKPIYGYEKLGCLMADGQRYGSGAKMALQNGGGVRFNTFEKPVFTVMDLLQLDPFGNIMYIYKLKGSELIDIIKDFRQNDEGMEGYTSGCSYEMTVDANDTVKVLDLKVYNEKGKPIKPNKTYKVAVNSYTASIFPILKRKEYKDTHKISSDCIREYLRDVDEIDYSNTVRSVIKHK